MVKLVDTRDLKSRARKGVPVRFRLGAPYLHYTINVSVIEPAHLAVMAVFFDCGTHYSGTQSARRGPSPKLAMEDL